MPQIVMVNKVDIDAEKFLSNCTDEELKEIWLLLQSERYWRKIENLNEKKAHQKQFTFDEEVDFLVTT